MLKGKLYSNNSSFIDKNNFNEGSQTNDFFQISPFIEITPLNEEIDDSFQRIYPLFQYPI